MFTHLQYGNQFDIMDESLIHYILVIRRNYRPIAYHNYCHAVGVTHAVFTWIVNGLLDPFMDKLELFSMMIAAFNHDIDHRGTNNQVHCPYLVPKDGTNQPLPVLYEFNNGASSL
jgi:dual 3',5'-cyclic-AMP and -GMP phosphodiesterase 11